MSESGIILHLTGMRAKKLGGMERYLIELARRSLLEGHRTVLQYETPMESSALREALREAKIETTVCATLAGPIRSVLRVGALIRRLRPRIVHAHFLNGYAHLAVPLIARRSGVLRCVATVHNELSDRRTDWHLRWAYGRYDRVLCVSEAIYRDLTRLGVPPAVVTMLHLGIFADSRKTPEERLAIRAELGLHEIARVLTCIARESPPKGLDVLFDVLSVLAHRHPQVEALVFGIDPGTSQFPGLAHARG